MRSRFDSIMKTLPPFFMAGLVLVILFGKFGTQIGAGLKIPPVRETASISNAGIPSGFPLPESLTSISQGNYVGRGITATEKAQHYLDAHRTDLGIKPYHELRAVEFQSPLGTQVKFSVFQDNIPVIGLGIELQVSPSGLVSISDNQYPDVSQAETPKEKILTFESVLKLHEQDYQIMEGAIPTQELSTFWFMRPGTNTPELAYVLSLRERNEEKKQVQVVFRATDGQILSRQYARSEF